MRFQHGSLALLSVFFACFAACHGQALSNTSAPVSPSVRAFLQSNTTWNVSRYLDFARVERTNPALALRIAETNRVNDELLVYNARRTITWLQDFKAIFPTNVDYWHFSIETAGERQWTVQTGIGGRYLLQMSVPFEADSTQTNIQRYGQPTLLLITYADPAPDGRDFCKGYDELSRRPIALNAWTNLVRAGGNLSVLGIPPSTNRPLPYFDSQWRMRR